jgi:molybdate transport system substrate-binding protein
VTRIRYVGLVLIVAAVLAGGCSKTHKTALHASGSINVFAAASLTEAFNATKAKLAGKNPDVAITYNFAGSQALAQQIIQGAPADVFASADQANMQKLVDAGLVETPKVFARNELEIAVAPGNPKHVTGLADLARADVATVLEDPSVPAGNYSQQVLAKAGVTVKPKSLELDVKSALAKVTSGEADAAIVYVSDVRAAGGKVLAVVIPDNQNVIATYPIAVVKATKNHAVAAAFVQEIVSGSGQAALMERGFYPA